MEENINIAAILKDKPQGTKLYSLTYGECFYQEYTGDFGIECQSKNGVQFNLDEYGRYCIDGKCILFPSKYMHDWHKFTWKKGDILQKNSHTQVIFDSFVSDTYDVIRCKYFLKVNNGNERFIKKTNVFTEDYFKVSEEQRQCYINKIEEHFGGKLNMETLEIEDSEFKNGGYHHHYASYWR